MCVYLCAVDETLWWYTLNDCMFVECAHHIFCDLLYFLIAYTVYVLYHFNLIQTNNFARLYFIFFFKNLYSFKLKLIERDMSMFVSLYFSYYYALFYLGDAQLTVMRILIRMWSIFPRLSTLKNKKWILFSLFPNWQESKILVQLTSTLNYFFGYTFLT